jgi:chromosome segregation ATPase
MGFGSTAKKLQRVTEVADKLYERFERLREQVNELTGTVEETNDRVASLEAELAEQRALLEALADEHDVDVATVTVDAATGDESADDTVAAGDAGAVDGND